MVKSCVIIIGGKMREGLWWNVDMTRRNLTWVLKRFSISSESFFIGCLNSTIAKAFVNRRRIFNHLYHALHYFEPSFSSLSLSTFHVRSKPHGDPVKRAYLKGRKTAHLQPPPPPPRLVVNLWHSHCTTWVVFTFAVYLFKHALRISQPLSYSWVSPTWPIA